MKILTAGRWLWTRTIGSTMVGEAVDSADLLPDRLPAGSGTDGSPDPGHASTNYCLKVGWEVVATPLTYKVVGFLKRAEHEDYYDIGTDFTPFSLKT